MEILGQSYVCREDRLRECILLLNALEYVSAENKGVNLKFHKLPVMLSRGTGIEYGTAVETYHRRNDSNVLFTLVDSIVDFYEFRFKEEFIVRVKNLNRFAWEISAFRKEGKNESAMLTDEKLQLHSNSVSFLIKSVVDILEMTCFYASLHETHTAMTIKLKRYIVFQYKSKEQENITLVGKAIKGTQSRDRPFRDFLHNICGWHIVSTSNFKKENNMGSEVHVGSPFFPIPYQFYKT